MDDMNWLAVAPEMVLLVAACTAALVDLWVTHPRRTPTYLIAQAALAVVALLHWRAFSAGDAVYAMQRMAIADPLGHLLGLVATLATMAALACSRSYAASRDMLKGELIVLALLSLLGILVMQSANNFLVIYLGLELMSLSLYALVALRRDDAVATEAAMKYFVLGALASGFLLYGLSMLYGATGSLEIGEVFKAIASGRINPSVLALGVVFVVSGLAFKLGAAPFHMWIPDVYHGAPTAVTQFVAGAPKLAAFAITIRLLVEGLMGAAQDWQQMLIVLSVASLALGNLGAIAQSNLKRMLAYSTIFHMGFVVLGLTPTVVSGNTLSAANGYSSSLFYVVTYVFTMLGTLGIVLLLTRDGYESDRIDDLAGLARRSPWYAAVMAIFMFSLAGIPPTVGFHSKLSVLQALVSTNLPHYIALAGIALVLSLIAAFYYLRVVKVMFFDAPAGDLTIDRSGEMRAVLSLNGAMVLGFGLLPGGLMSVCRDAIVKALAT